MAHKVICPQKKIIFRIFKISGTLIVTRTKNFKLKTFQENEAKSTIETKISTTGGKQER
jgi:hypothetical protein